MAASEWGAAAQNIALLPCCKNKHFFFFIKLFAFPISSISKFKGMGERVCETCYQVHFCFLTSPEPVNPAENILFGASVFVFCFLQLTDFLILAVEC